MRRSVAIACVFTLLATFGAPAAAAPSQGDTTAIEEVRATREVTGDLRERLKGAREGLFVVRLADEPVASYEGDKPGFAATKPDTGRGEQLEPDDPAARRYRDHLADQRGRVVSQIEQQLGRSVEVAHVYDLVINGFAAHFTPTEAVALLEVPGIIDVEPDELQQLQTDNGPAWMNADAVWGDPEDPEVGTRGEGVLVGIIDTGIMPSNPSFADPSPLDGYEHTNPLDGYVGVCDPTEPAFDPSFPCNDKLVGAWDLVTAQDSPSNDARDVDGHGSHTASTAVGNRVDATVVSPATEGLSFDRTISGVAPNANLISYRACGPTGCPITATNAAINQAVEDGVDVINYSIGGGTSNPWTSSNALAFLNARDAGVFVATSAGNEGPGADTVGSPADAPWLLSVAASTHDRNISNAVTDLDGSAGPLGDLVGKGFSGSYGPAPILYAGDYGDAMCLEEFPPGTFDGEIVICDRGVNARVEKGVHVLVGGAGGMILHNDPPNGATLNSDAHVLPAVHLSYVDGNALKAWLADGSGHEGAITGFVGVDEDPSWGDIMAAFSSRGPNAQVDVITPHVTAPGLDIIAAYGVGDPDPPEWNIVSGTSMASPHAAGAAALLVALHPDWSPDQVRSALMTTARTDLVKEDASTPADPFDLGSGHLDLAAASQAGLVLDETPLNYLDADPAEGGDPKTLNVPSMANSQCLVTCTWTRTVTATTTATWDISTSSVEGMSLSVSPSGPISLNAGESQELTFTANVGGATEEDWHFGEVAFTSDAAPRAHLPVAVVPTSGVLPGTTSIDTRRDAGSHLIQDLQTAPTPALTVDVHGLVVGDRFEDEVGQDPNNADPYDPLDDVWWTTFDVDEGSVRVVAEVLDTTAPDLDLFIGTGDTPSAETQVCSSTTPTSAERCDVDDPDAGEWWVLVQAWEASGGAPDPFTLSLGVVPGTDTDTMSVDAPEVVADDSPFDVRVFWDADMEAGERWYGAFSLGSSPDERGDIGTVGIDLIRHADDVTKSADVETAEPGDTVTYEIAVEPNVRRIDLEYTLTDTIPDGMTYVEGSVTGGATVSDGVVSWTGTMPTATGAQGDYVVATNADDPGCDTPLGDGYVDLRAFGIAPSPAITGDTVGFTAFTGGSPFRFYGQDHTGLSFTDDAFALFDFGANYGGAPWAPQALPDPNLPNNLIAMLWQDLQISYDGPTDRGVSLVSLGGDGPSSWAVVDYRGLHEYGNPDGESYDVQLWVQRQPAAGTHGIVIAYNELGSLAGPITVGVENADGTAAATLVNQGSAEGVISSDTVVCFAYEGPTFEPHVITYEVTVDEDASGGTATNSVVHDVDDPGSQPVTVSTDVEVQVAPPPQITSLRVSPAVARVLVGRNVQLTATARLDDGSSADVTGEAMWATSNPRVATVDDAGRVTGVGGGWAWITAEVDGVTATSQVIVIGRPSQPGPPPRPGPPWVPGPPTGPPWA